MVDKKVVDLASYRQFDEALDGLDDVGGHPTGGGGKGGGMEARVAVLETKVDRLVADVGDQQKLAVATREDLAVLKERVSHLPSKSYINTVVVAALALVAALIAFQQNIQTFFHIGH